jgi:hypothetical protein
LQRSQSNSNQQLCQQQQWQAPPLSGAALNERIPLHAEQRQRGQSTRSPDAKSKGNSSCRSSIFLSSHLEGTKIMIDLCSLNCPLQLLQQTWKELFDVLHQEV